MKEKKQFKFKHQSFMTNKICLSSSPLYILMLVDTAIFTFKSGNLMLAQKKNNQLFYI